MFDKTLAVVTANPGKLKEIEHFCGSVNSLDIELPEIQSTSGEEVALFKLEAALKHHPGPILVEDTGLTFDGMGSLPGPLIKWFVQNLDLFKLAELACRMGTGRARAQTYVVVGELITSQHEGPLSELPLSKLPLSKLQCKLEYQYISVNGVTDGVIVAPRGSLGFGWDAIFQPDGADKTFGEMPLEEKQHFSMRKKALEQLQTELSARSIRSK